MITSGSHRDMAAPEGDGMQILVVEDDADIRALLCDTLATYGFRASGFATAEAALHEIARQMPAAVILDLGLPDMDGMEAINRIRARGSVPILVLSARAHASDRIMGLEFGADDYVVKPFDPREIVARIRSLLRRANPPDQQAETDVKAARFAKRRDGSPGPCVMKPCTSFR